MSGEEGERRSSLIIMKEVGPVSSCMRYHEERQMLSSCLRIRRRDGCCLESRREASAVSGLGTG